jgi:TonB family protein
MLGLAVLCHPAHADLYSAQTAYDAGDYPKAFAQYKELAELGSSVAQLNLAVMYAGGKGTPLNNTFAYAWAVLAHEGGQEKAQELADRLRPELSPVSLRIAGEIHDQYSHAALEARLMPQQLPDAEVAAGDECHMIKVPNDSSFYPENAHMRGIQGSVFAEVNVWPDGRAHNIRILGAVPPGEFEDSVRSALHRGVFAPRHVDGHAAPCSMPIFFRFTIDELSTADYPGLRRYVDKTRQEAESGNPGSQLLYGMILEGLPQLGEQHAPALPWFVKAAQAGMPVAQFEVGYHLLQGRQCNCDENKAVMWFQRAAAADYPDAQVMLASYALRGTPTADNVKRAIVWLERAAAHGSRDGTLYLSALLAAAPVPEVHDPGRALKLLDGIFRKEKDEPSAYEIRAAARASTADYKGAVKDETYAIDRAKALGWDLAPLNERLTHYQAREPWQGNLFEF